MREEVKVRGDVFVIRTNEWSVIMIVTKYLVASENTNEELHRLHEWSSR